MHFGELVTTSGERLDTTASPSGGFNHRKEDRKGAEHPKTSSQKDSPGPAQWQPHRKHGGREGRRKGSSGALAWCPALGFPTISPLISQSRVIRGRVEPKRRGCCLSHRLHPSPPSISKILRKHTDRGRRDKGHPNKERAVGAGRLRGRLGWEEGCLAAPELPG